MGESKYSIAEAERCRFVFQAHARAVVHLGDLEESEVLGFAALAREVPAETSEDGEATKARLELVEDANPRFRKLWCAHMDRLKAADDTGDPLTVPPPKGDAFPDQPSAESE